MVPRVYLPELVLEVTSWFPECAAMVSVNSALLIQPSLYIVQGEIRADRLRVLGVQQRPSLRVGSSLNELVTHPRRPRGQELDSHRHQFLRHGALPALGPTR